MDGYELVGNALCLDFANTVNQRAEPGHDWLAEPGGLLRWAHHAALLPEAARRGDPPEVDPVGLREAVYLTFSAIADGREPDPSDLAVVRTVAAEGLAAARLVTPGRSSDATDQRRGRAAYALDWSGGSEERRVLWAVADSAVELLRHGPLERVGECPSCGWVFLDTSRNGRRRWCSMAMCGNAVKSARHYARTRR